MSACALCGTSQLYTGDAFTVPPGKTLLQIYYDSTFGGPQRLNGASMYFGTGWNTNIKLAYAYLWNNIGPDARLGPQIGYKWRFIGDGARKPSMAFSCLYAINNGTIKQAHGNDFGSLLIFQYPVKNYIYLANAGRVWVGDKALPDLEYFSFAAGKFTNPRTLVALEYSRLARMSANWPQPPADQLALGLVYNPDIGPGYSVQFAYLPNNPRISFHMTFQISNYF